MAITNGYCSLTEAKARMGEGVSGVSTYDTEIERMVEAVSRVIDTICGRRFYAASETRYFTADRAVECDVYDLLSVTTLKTDDDYDGTYETTWTTSDYILMPRNASVDGHPYTFIKVHPTGTRYFPLYEGAVELAGAFGYTATTPSSVKEACVLGTHQVFQRRNAPFGLMGADGFLHRLRYILQNDAEIMGLLQRYMRYV